MTVVLPGRREHGAQTLDRGDERRRRQDGPCAGRNEPGIDIDPALSQSPGCAGCRVQPKSGDRIAAPQRRDSEIAGAVVEGNPGAKFVEGEALDQFVTTRGFDVEQQRAVLLDDEEVEEVLALGRQKGGIDRPLGRELIDVVGNHALEEAARVLARYLNNAPIRQGGIVDRRHGLSRLRWVKSLL